QAIIAAAKKLGADAVHPGYGFLSENAAFARACLDAGLAFIGPTPEAIAAMGNKARAKARMLEAGVPCVPGFQGHGASDAAFAREAARIGFPVMIKAAAGGGGRGMRLVASPRDLAAALATARAEAQNAFGSDELILEKAVAGARHVEIQVLADTHGNVLHLGERDCSVQRRHQKVLEESPSPAVGADLRARMGASAVAAAKAIGYTNAGTVEFLLGADGAFYFLEMNTRLQVEHPVTELVTGLDLVEQQIRVARGERLAIAQADVTFNGHAIEARLYAEAPEQNFLPQSGHLVRWRPPSGPGVRVDHGLNREQAVSPDYDPLLAKVIAHGATREEARRRLVRALDDTTALGIRTNRRFLIDCLEHPDFVGGTATTEFIPARFSPYTVAPRDPALLALAAALWFERSAARYGHDPARAWSSSGPIAWPLALDPGDGMVPCTATILAPRCYRIESGTGTTDVHLLDASRDETARVRVADEERHAPFVFHDDVLHLALGRSELAVRDVLYVPATGHQAAESSARELRAPMNGKIVAVLVKNGDSVSKGQRLVVLEAMKMQHEMSAGAAGVVRRVTVKPGDQVANRQLLVELEPIPSHATQETAT
ncbi:MAG TPA: biotin carboxylase N-terminal domain-containing protein, partial [Hyphomicrobiaceae bacterium]|nr:biotin carboxylase N-terminal domain-containing protein [Hyphomicrobiaceae bacterium]